MPQLLGLHPLSLTGLGGSALDRVDLLGRNKVLAHRLVGAPSEQVKKTVHSAFARIVRNAFKYKSLSCWSYNIAVGCRHACRFCYVPDSQQAGRGKEKENTGVLARTLREYGILDPDLDWGQYVLLRPWDEEAFLASLRQAEQTPLDKLNADGNRAVILCSTTDPYQTLSIPGNAPKQHLLNAHARFLVRRALELILERSTLNVRILTRSPLARQDFELYKRFGSRLLFGMSLPTLREDLLKVYEPHAPAAKHRLATLEEAAQAGIPLYVAVAPTYPDLREEDLRAVLTAIQPLRPLTVFHEPINVRAENVKRIAAHAKNLGVTVRTDVFAGPAAWRRYAVAQLSAVQRIADELGLGDCLHLWPDKSLRSPEHFSRTLKALHRQKHASHQETRHEKSLRRHRDKEAYHHFLAWLNHWHHRCSEWPEPSSANPV